MSGYQKLNTMIETAQEERSSELSCTGGWVGKWVWTKFKKKSFSDIKKNVIGVFVLFFK